MTTAHGTSSQYGCALFSGERPEFSLSVWKKKKKQNKEKQNPNSLHKRKLPRRVYIFISPWL